MSVSFGTDHAVMATVGGLPGREGSHVILSVLTAGFDSGHLGGHIFLAGLQTVRAAHLCLLGTYSALALCLLLPSRRSRDSIVMSDRFLTKNRHGQKSR